MTEKFTRFYAQLNSQAAHVVVDPIDVLVFKLFLLLSGLERTVAKPDKLRSDLCHTFLTGKVVYFDPCAIEAYKCYLFYCLKEKLYAFGTKAFIAVFTV